MKDKWQSRAGRLVCLALALVGAYLVLEYALGILLPFLFAWGVSLVVTSLAKKSEKRFGGGGRAWRLFYVILFWSLLILVCVLALRHLIREGTELVVYIEENGTAISDSIENAVNGILELPSRLPFLEGLGVLGGYARDLAASIMEKMTQAGGELLAAAAGRLVSGASGAAIAVLVCVISSIYLSVDGERIGDFFFGWLSEEARGRARTVLERVEGGISGYGRAYFWMYIIAFAELYVGLLLLGRDYALLLALVIAFLDILPLFSAGLVLLPWGIVLIAQGSYAAGIGMIVIVAVMTVVRQAAEPRLIGKGLGIHPFASLMAMYVGLRLFGFWGTILAPMAVAVVREILDSGKKIEEKT